MGFSVAISSISVVVHGVVFSCAGVVTFWLVVLELWFPVSSMVRCGLWYHG